MNENLGAGDLIKKTIEKVTFKSVKDCIPCWKRQQQLNDLIPNIPIISQKRLYNLNDVRLPNNTINFLKRIENNIILVGGAAREPTKFKDFDFIYDGFDLQVVLKIFIEKSKDDIKNSVWPHLRDVIYKPDKDTIIYPFFNVREAKVKIPNVNVIPSLDYSSTNDQFKTYEQIIENKLYYYTTIYSETGIELKIKIVNKEYTPHFDVNHFNFINILTQYKDYLKIRST